jgi:hypothetical protein
MEQLVSHRTDFHKLDVGKSVHHHTIQINEPTRCNSFTRLLLDVYVSLKCFGRLHAHHQELTTALTASGFTIGALVIAALLVVVWPAGLAGRPDHDNNGCTKAPQCYLKYTLHVMFLLPVTMLVRLLY